MARRAYLENIHKALDHFVRQTELVLHATHILNRQRRRGDLAYFVWRIICPEALRAMYIESIVDHRNRSVLVDDDWSLSLCLRTLERCRQSHRCGRVGCRGWARRELQFIPACVTQCTVHAPVEAVGGPGGEWQLRCKRSNALRPSSTDG